MAMPKTGDWVRLDPSCYFDGPQQWAEVTHVNQGTASPYPIKVRFRNGLTGQFRESEVLDVKEGA